MRSLWSSPFVAFVRSLWSSPFIDWAVLDAMQTSGGVLLIWDKRVFEKLDVMVGQFSVSVLLRGVVDDFVWACTGVYGPNDNDQRSTFVRSYPRCMLGGLWLGVL